MKNDSVEQYIYNYFGKNQKDLPQVNLEKIKFGLSNTIYKASVNDTTVIFKVYGKLKEIGLINRKFEDHLIKINSEKGDIPKTLETDFKNYAISEFWPNVEHIKEVEIENSEFLEKLIEKIIDFELSLSLNSSSDSNLNFSNYDVILYLNETSKIAKVKFDEFNSKFQNWRKENPKEQISFKEENLSIIEKHLVNFDELLKKLIENLQTNNFILSHNDIHKDNIVKKRNDLKIFDYEYACFNYIGADIINLFIEGYFDLNINSYPFYKVKGDVSEVLKDDKYFEMYLKYIESLAVKSQGKLKLENSLKDKLYFKNVARLMCLFWLNSALLFLDFESNINRTGFNYIDYAVDRLYLIS